MFEIWDLQDKRKIISYCLTLDIVSFGLTTMSFRVSLRNLIVICIDSESLSSDDKCSHGICSWIGATVGCSQWNSSDSLSLNRN